MTVAPIKKQRRLAWAAGIGFVALLAGSGVAVAQEADDNYDHVLNTDKRFFDRVLGAIGLNSSGDEIQYRERSPLVIPPGRDLPPPEANAVAKNPAWPVDPDAQERKRAAAARKAGQPSANVDPAKPLSGTGALAVRGRSGTAKGSDYDSMKDEPGFFTRLMNGGLSGAKEEVGTFTGEPPRVSLTAPPPGYLTPSPAAPYGVTKRDMEPIPPKIKN